MKHNLLIIKKKDGKFIAMLNGKYIFEMVTTYGMPKEMVLDEVAKIWKEMSIDTKFNHKLLAWKEHIKEYPEDKREYSEEDNKECMKLCETRFTK